MSTEKPPFFISPQQAEALIDEALRPFIGRPINARTHDEMRAAVERAAEGVVVVYGPKPYGSLI